MPQTTPRSAPRLPIDAATVSVLDRRFLAVVDAETYELTTVELLVRMMRFGAAEFLVSWLRCPVNSRNNPNYIIADPEISFRSD
jgi:hypothetical protein